MYVWTIDQSGDLLNFRGVLVNDIKQLELMCEDPDDAALWSDRFKAAGILPEEVTWKY